MQNPNFGNRCFQAGATFNVRHLSSVSASPQVILLSSSDISLVSAVDMLTISRPHEKETEKQGKSCSELQRFEVRPAQKST